MAIRVGVKYFRTIKKCDEFVFVLAFIDFLTSSKKYVIPAEVTRNIILEGVPSTFESLSRGATIAIRDKNPSEVPDITGFFGFTSPAPADCRGSEDPRKVQDIPVYGPAQATASSVAVTNQLIAGGDCASAEQSIGSVRLPPFRSVVRLRRTKTLSIVQPLVLARYLLCRKAYLKLYVQVV